MPKPRIFLQTLSICILVSCLLQGNSLNVATAGKYPYSDPTGGRENYSLSGEKVNEARVYEFYQRQADYYMANPDKIPQVIPAHPGLDGGLHGHWGKYNQNNHNDGRWNDGNTGEHFTHVVKAKGLNVLKGICVKLGYDHALSTCFDPLSLSYRAVWDGWVRFEPFRWGCSRGANIEGNPWFTLNKAEMPEDGNYLGFHRFGKRVVFEYEIGKTRIQDEPWATKNTFFRRIDLLNQSEKITLPCKLTDEAIKVSFIETNGIEDIRWENGEIIAEGIQKKAYFIVRISKESVHSDEANAIAHLKSERKLKKRWNEILKVPGKLGKPAGTSRYAIDTLTVPYDNPYKTVMQLTSLAFLPNGNALVATLPGDIWLVKGIDQDLKNVTWQRYATGFNQPIGIHVDEDGVFVLDRGQIYLLHDRNGDEEVDHYEKYANDFGSYDRSHTHTFGLHRTADKAFHFIQRTDIFRTDRDRTTQKIASGVRNCMGVGGTDDYFWAAPQEGTWTPTSAILEVVRGEEYGLAGKNISAPLCFIPRGVDNSTGGMLEITSDKWGPFMGSHIGLSYGSGTHYLILRDATSIRPQGAVVPLEGNFLAGVMRGDFHPKDGQLYVAGLDGWGDYSVKDGCLHRVRYLGGKVRKPKGFKVHANGIRIDFTTRLDSSDTGDLKRYFAQVWNYEYAKRYGSPEFSISQPESLGHDRLNIRSVSLLEDGKSIFVELPKLEPVMQLHLRMHLKDADGTEFKTDLFASPMYPDSPFTAKSLAPPVPGKATFVSLRIAGQTTNRKKQNWSGQQTEGERLVVNDAISGLKYSKTLIKAKTGEALALKLNNNDAMPHNLVIVAKESAQKVGDASFKMLSDPKAGEKNYAPDLSEVLHVIPVINPGEAHTLHFRTPETPGDYPFICTFPGHWMAMQGILKVE